MTKFCQPNGVWKPYIRNVRVTNLLNCVPCVLKTCSRVNVPCVLTCYRVNVPCVLTAHVPTFFACLRANVSCVCLCAHVPMCFVCSCPHVSTWLVSSCAHVWTCFEPDTTCVTTWSPFFSLTAIAVEVVHIVGKAEEFN